MKALYNLYIRWRNRRLFMRLFFTYADKNNGVDYTLYQTILAYSVITGEKWNDEDFLSDFTKRQLF